MTYSDWFQKIVDEALLSPHCDDPIPALKAPATPAQGAAEQLQALLVIEAFGLPKPSAEPVSHRELLL